MDQKKDLDIEENLATSETGDQKELQNENSQENIISSDKEFDLESRPEDEAIMEPESNIETEIRPESELKSEKELESQPQQESGAESTSEKQVDSEKESSTEFKDELVEHEKESSLEESKKGVESEKELNKDQEEVSDKKPTESEKVLNKDQEEISDKKPTESEKELNNDQEEIGDKKSTESKKDSKNEKQAESEETLKSKSSSEKKVKSEKESKSIPESDHKQETKSKPASEQQESSSKSTRKTKSLRRLSKGIDKSQKESNPVSRDKKSKRDLTSNVAHGISTNESQKTEGVASNSQKSRSKDSQKLDDCSGDELKQNKPSKYQKGLSAEDEKTAKSSASRDNKLKKGSSHGKSKTNLSQINSGTSVENIDNNNNNSPSPPSSDPVPPPLPSNDPVPPPPPSSDPVPPPPSNDPVLPPKPVNNNNNNNASINKQQKAPPLPEDPPPHFSSENLANEGSTEPSRFCKALYNYKTDNENCISFLAGDIVIIMDSSRDDWWVGQIGNSIGYFPKNYCESVDENEVIKYIASLKKNPKVAVLEKKEGEPKTKQEAQIMMQNLKDEHKALLATSAEIKKEIGDLSEKVRQSFKNTKNEFLQESESLPPCFYHIPPLDYFKNSLRYIYESLGNVIDSESNLTKFVDSMEPYLDEWMVEFEEIAKETRLKYESLLKIISQAKALNDKSVEDCKFMRHFGSFQILSLLDHLESNSPTSLNKTKRRFLKKRRHSKGSGSSNNLDKALRHSREKLERFQSEIEAEEND